MRIEIRLVDDRGRTYEGESELEVSTTVHSARRPAGEASRHQSRAGRRAKPQSSTANPTEIDFGKPVRPFMKVYGRGLSGSRKFALLLARTCGGDETREVALMQLEKAWNRMAALLGQKFNHYFPAEAKDKDWVESPKKGVYRLRPNWREIISESDSNDELR